jgi:hypothetical protein
LRGDGLSDRLITAERDGYFRDGYFRDGYFTETGMGEFHFFDPRAEFSIVERKLPHWTQPGTVCFITWRTNDSLPKEVVERWRHERFHWLRRQGINPNAVNWREELRQLDLSLQHEFFDHFSTRWHDELDACHGACVLKDPANARIVTESLLYAHGELYELTDFVVMPNHVHLLAVFLSEDAMLEQCESWKHFTARKINRRIGDSGRFWQQDGFDHLVRSEEQFEHFRKYIADNPSKARLADGEYVHWSK